MSDSMQKILAEMRRLSAGRCGNALADFADDIEALMREPLTYTNKEHDLFDDNGLISGCDKPIPLFAAPPDTQALIDAAREECLWILENGKGSFADAAEQIRSRIGKPLEKKP